jgi:glycine cleavage system transcriptional repressor
MSKSYYVLTAVGPNRPGLVDALGEYVFIRGGNVESSRAATLGGEFAVLMLITCPAEAGAAIEGQLDQLKQRADLTCTARRTSAPAGGASPAGTLPFQLNVHSMDHPGIVQAVAHELAEMGVDIELLDTHVESAPHTGTALFHFHAQLNVPSAINLPAFRRKLEALADRLNVDISLSAETQ